MEYSPVTIHFLDVVITNTDGILHTSVYTKPTDRKMYLHFDSRHPLHVKRAIPYSQAVRYRRNTDLDVQVDQGLTLFFR